MASLRSIILDGWFAGTPETYKDESAHRIETHIAREAQKILASHDTVLVNATSVAKDLTRSVYEGKLDREPTSVPCPKPPFHSMWLETNNTGDRIGALVQRVDVLPGEDMLHALIRLGSPWAELAKYKRESGTDLPALSLMERDRPTTIILAQLWHEVPNQGSATYCGGIQCWLNESGDFQDYVYLVWPAPEKEPIEREDKIRLDTFMLWVLHTFGRLNCHNVKLLPMKAGAPSPKQLKKHKEPLTVWHEIVVEQVVERHASHPGAASGEKTDLRFHKVRGHYADYTKGAGLFGRYKVRIWVEEHSRGNMELGEVVASYTVN